MPTLADLLALLADSPPGNISAADMRSVITDTWGKGETDRIASLVTNARAWPGPLATDVPTVTIGTTQTITQRGQLWHNTVTELQSRGFWDNPNGRYKVQTGGALFSGAGVILNGTTFEMVWVPNGTTQDYLVVVDGRPMTADWQTHTGTTGDQYFKLVFPSAGVRHVEVYVTSLLGWKVITTPFSDTVTPAPRKKVLGIVGDSFVGGSDGSKSHKSFGWFLANALGMEYGGRGLGGTGYIGTDNYGDAGRVADMVDVNPDVLVIAGTVNDDGDAGVQAAADACYDAYAAALPGVPIIVFGPQPTGAGPTLSANRQANVAAVRDAAVANPNVLAFFDMIGIADGIPAAWSAGSYAHGSVVTHLGAVWVANFQEGYTTSSTPGSNAIGGKWNRVTYALDGTGNTGATAGNGTRDTMVYSDNLHPTEAGQRGLFAEMLAPLTTALTG